MIDNTQDQDALRRDVKLWLKANGHDYAWLAQRCFVSENTVRNWMARKPIPAAKVYIIHDLVRQMPMSLPASFVEVSNETVVTLRLGDDVRTPLEKMAFSQGLTLNELIESELRKMVLRRD